MMSKKIWVIAICLILVLFCFTILNRPWVAQQPQTEEQQSLSGDSTAVFSDKTGAPVSDQKDGKETEKADGIAADAENASTENESAAENKKGSETGTADSAVIVGGNAESGSSEQSSSSGEQDPASGVDVDTDHVTEVETEDGLVVTIPEGMSIGEGDD